MAEIPLSPGKKSSEFITTAAIIGGAVYLIAIDKIPPEVVDELIWLGIAYIGGRSLPKTAEQIKSLGRNKQVDELLERALAKERKDEGT